MSLSPVIFTDGTHYFEELKKRYISHKKGLFILAPSGAGKTHFCKNQKEAHWIDGDVVWVETKAQPTDNWWDHGLDTIFRVEQRCDVITAQAIDNGFWVMGSVNNWLKPDAIVIPPWDTLVAYVQKRYETNYDGGMTPNHHEQLKAHTSWIEKWHTEHGVPRFESIEEAVSELT